MSWLWYVLAGLSASSMDERERSTDISMDELAALAEKICM